MIAPRILSTVVGVALTSSRAFAQTNDLPAVRRLSAPATTSAKSFRSIASVRTLRGGRLIVNDIGGHRLLLVDTMFSIVAAIADTEPATTTPYGPRPGGLIPFRGDSSVFVETQTPAMYVIDPRGAVVRAMSVPNPRSAVSMTQPSGGGWTSSDPRGRFIYRGSAPRSVIPQPKPGQLIPFSYPDSNSILRVDPATRTEQPVAWYKTFKYAGVREGLGNGPSVFWLSIDPLPITEDFAVLSDGTIAILRGDYHIELIDLDGQRSSLPRIPYPWQRMSDAAKIALIDSLRKASDDANRPTKTGTTSGGSSISGGGGLSVGGAPFTPSPAAKEYEFVKPMALPDYRPAFEPGALRVDAHDNLWIRTLQPARSTDVSIYDVVTRQGKLIDRIELPKDRTIVGFDETSIYLAARESGVGWLERVKIR
jgi:hypothetical protein